MSRCYGMIKLEKLESKLLDELVKKYSVSIENIGYYIDCLKEAMENGEVFGRPEWIEKSPTETLINILFDMNDEYYDGDVDLSMLIDDLQSVKTRLDQEIIMEIESGDYGSFVVQYSKLVINNGNGTYIRYELDDDDFEEKYFDKWDFDYNDLENAFSEGVKVLDKKDLTSITIGKGIDSNKAKSTL